MTDNLPTIRQAAEIANTDTDSWIQVVGAISRLASQICDTEFVPKGLRGSMPATAAAMLYGREVGLPPMTALTQTQVIEGKPSISAEAMRAMVLAAGHDFEFTESTGAICRMRGRRRGSERWTEVVWTIDMARAAGLLGKSNWKGYPRRMLQARATSELAEMVFPDVIHGFRSIEETEDMGGESTPAAELTGPKTTVKRTTRRATAALPAGRREETAAPSAPAAAVAPQGPPLPGEDGYDELVAGPKTADMVEGETDDGTGDTGPGNDPEATPSTTPETSDAGEPPGDAHPGPETGGSAAEGSHSPASEHTPPRPSSRAQHRMLFVQLGDKGVDPKDDEERLLIVSKLASRPIDSFNGLTAAEASHCIDTLGRLPDRTALNELLDAIDAKAES